MATSMRRAYHRVSTLRTTTSVNLYTFVRRLADAALASSAVRRLSLPWRRSTPEPPDPPPAVVDDRNARYDRETVEIIGRVLVGDAVGLDIGANEGAILAHLLAAAPEGAHHAFEPIPALAAGLRDRFPTVAVHEVALSDASGAAEFHHVVSNPGYSGLRRRRYDRPDEQVVVTEVRTARLDDEVDPATPVRLVKVDVEGGELGVFRGGLGLLSRQRPYVIFEHGLGAADHYGTRPEVVFDLLTGEVGLNVTLMERWLVGGADLTRDEFVDEFAVCRNYYFLAYPPG